MAIDLLIFDCCRFGIGSLPVMVPVGGIVLILHALAGCSITFNLHPNVIVLGNVVTFRKQILLEF